MNFKRVASKILNGKQLRILMLNDNGFQYGAGIAQLRQIQSLLLSGHEVFGMCWQQGSIEASIPFKPKSANGIWHGMHCFLPLDGRTGMNRSVIVSVLVDAVLRVRPDVIITGNLHGCRWPVELLPALNSCGCLVIAYMHDCHYITGRCTHPFSCRSFTTGCDEQCETAHEHPALPPLTISADWQLRQNIFSDYPGIALAVNSQWTLNMAKSAFPKPNFIDMVRLGLDHALFSPIPRDIARRVLGLPEDSFIIVAGAVNVKDPHKGGWIFEKIVQRLTGDALFLVFGQALDLGSILSTGLIRDYRKMPLLYSAADLFIGTSLAESFGQTYCEAASCGLPIVAFRIGGIPDIAHHDVNARLVEEIDIEKYLEEIRFFMDNPEERFGFGANGRKLVEQEFTLAKQADRWELFFNAFARHIYG